MPFEPMPRRASGPNKPGWRPWYPAIADWMLRNPGAPLSECAKALGKHPQTVNIIARTDMFKEYFARRREEWTQMHDFALVAKTTKVAERALDLMADKLEKQGDKIPMNLLNEVAMGTLDRLGYAPKAPGPSVAVNVSNNDNRVVMIPIDANALQEARDAIRLAEQRRTIEHQELEVEPESAADEAQDAGDAQSIEPPSRS
jgi:hypothetical protein